MTIEELIAALEKSTGPSRDLDADILEATGGCAHRETEYYCIEDGNDTDSGFTCKKCHKDTYGERVPAFTASMDAAVSLIGDDEFEMTNLYGVARVTIHNQGDFGPSYGSSDGGSLPIAICIAALRSKLTQEKNNADK